MKISSLVVLAGTTYYLSTTAFAGQAPAAFIPQNPTFPVAPYEQTGSMGRPARINLSPEKKNLLDLVVKKIKGGEKTVSCKVSMNGDAPKNSKVSLQRLKYNIHKNNTLEITEKGKGNNLTYIISYTGLAGSMEPDVKKVYRCPYSNLASHREKP